MLEDAAAGGESVLDHPVLDGHSTRMQTIVIGKAANQATRPPADAAVLTIPARLRSVRELGHPELQKLAHELTEKLRASATINWQNRKPARAKMLAMVKVLLAKYKYPPDRQAEATDRVLTQAELLADTWAAS